MADAIAGGAIDAPAEAPSIAPAALGYRRYALWLLMSVYIVNFLDRQVVNIVAEKIKLDLKLTNADIGLVSGGVFAIFYTVLGIPIARAARLRAAC
jgi:sugar phosphate permease